MIRDWQEHSLNMDFSHIDTKYGRPSDIDMWYITPSNFLITAEIKGDRCFYCGSRAEEYHHIVPRHMGGDNRLENIVPMCAECHKKAHSKRSYKRQAQWGRPKQNLPDNYETVVGLYLDSKITLETALALTGMKRNKWYMSLAEYRKKTGDMRQHTQIH